MYTITKRLLDIVFASVAIILLLPLMLPIIIALKLTGEGYIWYLQERVGYKNQPFMIYKFATMLKDSPNMQGGVITTKKDPRLTPLGGFLRSTKINELPQLLNILFGQMSFIGPRPVMKISFNAYPTAVQKQIYNVKPGLTGIGSVIFRDEEHLISEVKNNGGDTWKFYTEKIYPYKGMLEFWYQEKQSLLTDIKIVVITAWVIINPSSNIVYNWFKEIPQRQF
jgi:lipopolysaccharide/colanic/teichoic acid biosynthesis glycosyltransferase